MKNIKSIFCFIIVGSFMLGCNFGAKTTEEREATSLENIKHIVEQKLEYPIPTAFEVTAFLQNAGAAFVWDITNPVSNVDKYETQRDKALNLGIYGADLSYACTYKSTEATMALFKVSKILVDELEIPGVFDTKMVTSIEQNLDNNDSLISIVTQSFYDTYAELNKAGHGKLSLLVVAASWIEGLYITSELTVFSNYDEHMLKIVADQKKSAIKLATLAEQYAEDPDVESIRPLFQFMKIVYDGVNPDIGLTKGQLDDIRANVSSARNDIIN